MTMMVPTTTACHFGDRGPCMTSLAERLARALPKARREGDHWRACCPAHPDENPSLTVNDGRNERILVRCWSAGCPYEAIVAAARARGIWPNGDGSRLSGNNCFGAKENGDSRKTPPESPQPRNRGTVAGGKAQSSAAGKVFDG